MVRTFLDPAVVGARGFTTIGRWPVVPTLTGSIADVVGAPLVAGQVRQAFVKAPAARGSLAGDHLVVSAPVPVDAAGSVSIALEPGPAVLVVDTYAGGPDVYDLYVTADMTLLSEAVAEAAPAHERSWVESVMVQLHADALVAAEAAQTAAGSFGLTVTSSTGAAGSQASVTVTGDGPAYELGFTVPRGDKGDTGDEGTTEWSGLSGKPAAFPPGSHSHPVSDIDATGTATSSRYLRGDGKWETPTNTTYSAPSQSEAEAGTSTTGRVFSAQRVRQAVDARAVTRYGDTQGLWIGPTSSLPSSGTTGVLYVTTD